MIQLNSDLTAVSASLTELNTYASQTFVALNDVTSARTYLDATVDIHKEGYLPIEIGYQSNRLNMNIYTMYISFTNNQWIAHYGIATTDGSTFNHLTFTLYVRYKKLLPS